MASLSSSIATLKVLRPLAVARLSTTSVVSQQRFGDHTGSSGWKWEKGGVGMGGKTSDIATEVKPDTGKGKKYQVT